MQLQPDMLMIGKRASLRRLQGLERKWIWQSAKWLHAFAFDEIQQHYNLAAKYSVQLKSILLSPACGSQQSEKVLAFLSDKRRRVQYLSLSRRGVHPLGIDRHFGFLGRANGTLRLSSDDYSSDQQWVLDSAPRDFDDTNIVHVEVGLVFGADCHASFSHQRTQDFLEAIELAGKRALDASLHLYCKKLPLR